MKNSQIDGVTYGIPFQRSTPVLYYNKDAFREAGLDPEKPPQNWAEQLEYAVNTLGFKGASIGGHVEGEVPASEKYDPFWAKAEELDVEVGLSFDLLRIGDRFIPDLVQRIRCIGDQLTQKDLLVRIEGVDDQTHQLLDISIEGKGFRHDVETKVKVELEKLTCRLGALGKKVLIVRFQFALFCSEFCMVEILCRAIWVVRSLR